MASRTQVALFALALLTPCALNAQADTQSDSKPAPPDSGISGVPPIYPSNVHSRAQESDYRQSHSVIHTFYLRNASFPNDGNELLTGLRLLLEPSIKIYLVPNQNAIVMSLIPTEVPIVESYLAAVDRPKHLYRLTYTVTESDSGKRIGVQNFSIDLLNNQRTTMKNGSKIPVVTGSYSNGSATEASGVQTQFTYLDIGITVDATVSETATGVVLKSKFEQSSMAQPQVIANVSEPVIRQTVVEGVTQLTPGKSVNLGATDIPGSTRHLDLEVTLQPQP